MAACSTADSDDITDARASAAPSDFAAYQYAVRNAAERIANGSAGVDERIDITGDGG
ncbi:hypothetical protein [Streptomyces sp. Tue6028]|uniref:hypothetical protein n=1 Tax=Streptomyces sp. Tue6028 TaxID=2036037 RepID=UPI003D755AF6